MSALGFAPISTTAISDTAPDFSAVSGIGDLEFNVTAIQTNYIQQILNEQRSRRMILTIELPVQTI